MRKILKPLGALVVVTLAACSVGDGVRPDNLRFDDQVPTSVSLDNCLGVQTALLAEFSDGGIARFNTRARFRSTNENVFTVSNESGFEGRVFPNLANPAGGTAQVVASFDGLADATYTITVTPATEQYLQLMTLDPLLVANSNGALTVMENTTNQFSLAAIFSDGTPANHELANYGVNVEVESSDTSIVGVNSNSISGVAPGSAAVTIKGCERPDGSFAFTKTVNVTVAPQPTTTAALTLEPSATTTFPVNDVETLSLLADLGSNNFQNITGLATYAPNPAASTYLTVTPASVTATQTGSGDAVDVTFNGLTVTSGSFTVVDDTLQSIELRGQAPASTADPITLVEGVLLSLDVEATYADSSTQLVTEGATLGNSDATVVGQLPFSNKVRALEVGTTTLTAAFDNVEDTLTVNVVEGTLDSITLVAVESAPVNGLQQYRAEGTYTTVSNGSLTFDITDLVTWESSDPDQVLATMGVDGGQAVDVTGSGSGTNIRVYLDGKVSNDCTFGSAC